MRRRVAFLIVALFLSIALPTLVQAAFSVDSNTVIRSCLERHNSAKGEPARVSAYVLAAPPRVRVPGGTMPTRAYGSPALWGCVAGELP